MAHLGSGLGLCAGRERLSYISVLIYVFVAGECVCVRVFAFSGKIFHFGSGMMRGLREGGGRL